MPDSLDYDLDATVAADTPEKLRALADPVRDVIIDLVLEHAMSVTEIAGRVGKPKGTVAHHVDVLVDTGLLKVVRTRKVRAMEERFYGRVGRTIVYPNTEYPDDLPFFAQARDEIDRDRAMTDEAGGFTMRHARVPAEKVAEFTERVMDLAVEFTTLPRGGEVEYAFLAGVFPTNRRVAARPKGSRK